MKTESTETDNTVTEKQEKEQGRWQGDRKSHQRVKIESTGQTTVP